MYEKKKNPLAYLGWLGLIGVWGICINALWMKVFVFFFAFFLYAKVTPDELFWKNVRKSAVRAFVVNVVLTVICMAFVAVRARWLSDLGPFYIEQVTQEVWKIDTAYLSQLMLLSTLYVVGFVVTLCTFIFGVLYEMHKEKKLLGDESC